MSHSSFAPIGDAEIAAAIDLELDRQQNQIELIASENIVSRDVLNAQGSVLSNKYAEGYPGKRYYGGCEHVDVVEQIAIERAKKLFGAGFANVQPHSGAQANQAVFLALLNPGDRIMGMSLAHGGHLTHGSPVTMSGKWFDVVSYEVRAADQIIDMDNVRETARAKRPKLIIAGASAYPRAIDFAGFRAIADEVGAHLMVDMAHYAGLIAAKLYPDPLPHAHVVTTTTHKTLRGPRGGMILTNDEALAKKINSAVFPGNQGGPLMHVIAAKAVAFGEALRPTFNDYAKSVIANARVLAEQLLRGGLGIVSGGTDCHMVLVDLRPMGITGRDAERSLERAGLTCNKNAIRSRETICHLRHPPRKFRRYDARLRWRGVPAHWPTHHRRPCGTRQVRAGGRCSDRSGSSRRGSRPLRAVSDLPPAEVVFVMFLSTFDIFKIGMGPSSSHTMGPMIAAARFLDELRDWKANVPGSSIPKRLGVSLHGSLAFTGKGHGTDRAVMLGLLGCRPETLDPDTAEQFEANLRSMGRINSPDLGELVFESERDLVFDYGPPLPGHANGVVLSALDGAGNLCLTRTYYSIGGGFVLTEQELAADRSSSGVQPVGVPYPFASATQMLDMGRVSGKTIAEMKRANELASGVADLDHRLDHIWKAMKDCIDRGLSKDGVLAGGLKVRRRAKAIHDQLLAERGSNSSQPHVANEWLSVYAMAVNEENAAGGKVVSSPTNGAAGVVPAVLRYYIAHCFGSTHAGLRDFMLVAAAIGGLIKHNASISGAEVGCQGEVGSASAMAAAGLSAALGGTNEQVENAAEIALEHHLGMTCDPAGGLVQIPCIERNGLGAIKAVAAASLALRGDGTHLVPLDSCIETMRQTGIDMNVKYKETSQGGLAVNLPGC